MTTFCNLCSTIANMGDVGDLDDANATDATTSPKRVDDDDDDDDETPADRILRGLPGIYTICRFMSPAATHAIVPNFVARCRAT
jgi:hypothetical protein